jgi:hypothetical protein
MSEQSDSLDELIERLGERGDLDGLRRIADGGNTTAAEVLAELTTD